MKTGHQKRALLAASSVLASLSIGMPAFGQEDDPSASTPESSEGRVLSTVIVTARKREERLQDVPVVVAAFNKEQLDAFAAGGFEDVAAITPGLIIDEGGGAGQGNITLRGVTTGVLNLSSDQAISINIDGVQLSNADALRFGQFDMEQFELLKGPQALFFGKNSPGGIMSIRTSDPTSESFSQVRVGYEFDADESFGELIVAGPIIPTLGGRLFLRASETKGQLRNLAPGVAYPRVQETQDFFGRLTLAWNPAEAFDARFKLSYGESEGSDQGIEQRFACASTGAISGAIDTCDFDTDIVKGDPDPRLAGVSSTFTAKPSSAVEPFLTSSEMNYDVSDALTLSSVTGYSDIRYANYANLLPVISALFIGGVDQSTTSLSQEIRLTSDFKGPLNFMLGAFVDDRTFETDQGQLVPAPPVFGAGARLLFANTQKVASNSQSLFAQLQWDVTDTLELSGGARYTQEERTLSGIGALTPGGSAVLPAGSFVRPVVPTGPFLPNPSQVSYDDVSPEVALTWRPSSDLTAFAAYKQGFLSGGFNTSVTGNAAQATVSSDQSYRPQTVDGFEAGIKSTPFPSLRVNASAFRYTYDNIQLSTFDFGGSGTSISTRVVNASKALTQGVEIDAVWEPQGLDGLTLNGGLAYNDSEYVADYFERCNGPQIARQLPGCDFVATRSGAVPVAAGTGGAQNLKGSVLGRAPELTGLAGFSYEAPINDVFLLKLNGSASYSSSYQANAAYDPRAEQDAFWTFNAGVGLRDADDRWAIDLIGRNLTDELYLTGAGGNVPLGGTVPGVSPGEMQGPVSRPRTFLLQLTVRPSAF
jgi:iron complex outermembrane receptor protein